MRHTATRMLALLRGIQEYFSEQRMRYFLASNTGEWSGSVVPGLHGIIQHGDVFCILIERHIVTINSLLMNFQ